MNHGVVGVVDSVDGIVSVGDRIMVLLVLWIEYMASVLDGWGYIGIGLHGAGVISSVVDCWGGIGIGLDGMGASWGVIDVKSSTCNLFVASHFILFVDCSLCPVYWLYVTMD